MNRNTPPALVIVVCFLVSPSHADAPSDIDLIRREIPFATAMKKADFEKMATAVEAPREEDFDDKSLTLVTVFAWKVAEEEPTPEQKAEFSFSDEFFPKPSDLAEEVGRYKGVGRFRFPAGPITVVHSDRITAFTCKIDGDAATGTVNYQVPKLYRGRFAYTAKKVDGKWRITQIDMPANKIHLVRGDSGEWQKQDKP